MRPASSTCGGAVILALGVTLAACGGPAPEMPAEPAADAPPPPSRPSDGVFHIDPYWPQDLPGDWLLGNVVGVAVDSSDNVWITHRPNSQRGGENTPPVIAFDQAGAVVASWGDPGGDCDWGTQAHGIYVDHEDNVWVGFGGGLPYDLSTRATTDNALVVKLTPAGDCLLQVGDFGFGTDGSNSTMHLGQPTDIWVDAEANEVYISDGYTNRRVIVFDAATGEYRRHWGAYGNAPDDTPTPPWNRGDPEPQQFSTPHCVAGANDGMVYVCDRGNQRIQVFDKDGTFVKEALVDAPLGNGDVGGNPWDIGFSTDAEQSLLVVADGRTHRVHTLNRDTLEAVTSFGRRGRWAGNFESPHSLAVDSMGNLYVGDTLDGRRVQRFVHGQ